MKKTDTLNLIEASLASGQASYARKVAQRYLADWPGDLELQFVLARAAVLEADGALAVQALQELTAADPEDFAAQRLLGVQLLRQEARDFAAHAFGCAHIGDGQDTAGGLSLPAWAPPLRAAFLAERVGDWETAQRESAAALAGEMPTPLPSLLHLAALWHAGKLDLALPLAEGFHARWPRVVAFKLCLAECLFAQNQSARALDLLHDAAAQDLTGRVAERHWGRSHPYRSLWEGVAGTLGSLPGPLPAPLITTLGLNRLQPAPGASPAPSTEIKTPRAEPAASAAPGAGPSRGPSAEAEVLEIRAQIDALTRQILGKQAAPQTPSGQHYLILSSHTRLLQQYGQEGFQSVDGLLQALAASATRRSGMQASVLYADDPRALAPFGLRPVDPGNAWEIKHLVAEIAAALKARGGEIGTLLIIGGDEIIPFHRLPNPTDDVDPDIPSDNPYATPDENYFVPEWPVGRIPSGAGSDPAPLLRALRLVIGSAEAAKSGARTGRLGQLLDWLFGWLKPAGGSTGRLTRHSFGYSANVWREASSAVYTTIGNPRDLLTSPPVDAAALPAEGLSPSRLSYFNLHGVEDGPEWYGQRSHDDPGSLPEYPVALRPTDVVNSGRAPLLVFSEACYGANITGKTPESALCLRFLDSGSRAVVASTKIAYGSVATPLIGADLLGWCFWQNVNQGLPVGESLRRAKLQTAQEMHTRQGFLDGEDQKTLISFVLYGDPLMTLPDIQPGKAAKSPAPRLAASPTVCDRCEAGESVPPETVARIKAVVARYLPGMRDADMQVSHPHAACHSQAHVCPTGQLAAQAKSLPAVARTPRGTVVTLSKTIRTAARAHPHYARLTFNEKGDVIKMAVSR